MEKHFASPGHKERGKGGLISTGHSCKCKLPHEITLRTRPGKEASRQGDELRSHVMCTIKSMTVSAAMQTALQLQRKTLPSPSCGSKLQSQLCYQFHMHQRATWIFLLNMANSLTLTIAVASLRPTTLMFLFFLLLLLQTG